MYTHPFGRYIECLITDMSESDVDENWKGVKSLTVDTSDCFGKGVLLLLLKWYRVLDFVVGHFGVRYSTHARCS